MSDALIAVNIARNRARGFTLVELMITLAIMAIVITIGIPSLSGFVAAQRVRATASDLVADIALARAEAIKESRRVSIERLPGTTNTWKDGWRVCVLGVNPADFSCDAANVRKISTAVTGRTKVCATVAGLDDRIVFHPDGRIRPAEGSPPLLGNDGIRVSDDNDDANTANDRIRLVFLGVSGRARVEIQDNDPANPTRGTACP